VEELALRHREAGYREVFLFIALFAHCAAGEIGLSNRVDFPWIMPFG
jgi:hypothetical protein